MALTPHPEAGTPGGEVWPSPTSQLQQHHPRSSFYTRLRIRTRNNDYLKAGGYF